MSRASHTCVKVGYSNEKVTGIGMSVCGRNMNSVSDFDSGDLIKLTFYYGEKITDCNNVISWSVEKRQCLLCSQTFDISVSIEDAVKQHISKKHFACAVFFVFNEKKGKLFATIILAFHYLQIIFKTVFYLFNVVQVAKFFKFCLSVA